MEYANIFNAKQKDSVLIVYFRPTRPFDLVSMAGCIARGTEERTRVTAALAGLQILVLRSDLELAERVLY